MRLSRFIVGVLICVCTTSAHAQLSMGGSMRSWERQRRHYWDQFYKAKESGKDLNYFLRAEFGVGTTLGTSIFRLHNHKEDPDTRYYFDTTVNMIIRPKYALAFNEYMGYPIVAMGSGAALILTYGISARITRFDIDALKLGNYTTNFIFTNLDLGIPLSIDYKSGGEAMLDKSKRFCFTLGAGLEPLWISGQMNLQNTSQTVGIKPFLKAEIGYLTNFAGFKLRASYLSGGYTYFHGDGVANGSEIKLSGDNQFAISLVILEMLTQWED